MRLRGSKHINGRGACEGPQLRTCSLYRPAWNISGRSAQELCRHLQRCLKHEDVAQQLTLRDLNLACEHWACNSLRELTEEMEMWEWDSALDNKWARVTKCSQLLSIPVEMPGAPEERRGTSWARATRELRRLRHRIEAVGGSKDQWEAGVWHMEKQQWDLAMGSDELDRHAPRDPCCCEGVEGRIP